MLYYILFQFNSRISSQTYVMYNSNEKSLFVIPLKINGSFLTDIL